MKPSLKTSTCRTVGAVAALTAGLTLGPSTVSVAAERVGLPVAQQNALIQKHCAVCHNDATMDGGLSLEHFDAAQAAPSLAAMMLSKLTSGIPLETVKAAASDLTVAALVANKLKGGAINAAGIPVPDKAIVEALATALASTATGANEWQMYRTEDAARNAPITTASILREMPSRDTGEAETYRLVLSCNAATHEGEMQLAWSPVPKKGIVSAIVDGKKRFTYNVEGNERMGNGTPGVPAAAAVSLYGPKKDAQSPRMLLPTQTLTISDLFPNETVEFPFGGLTQAARKALSPCFTE
jgi:hypothetical protein